MPQTELMAQELIRRLQNQIGDLVCQLTVKDMQLEVTISERDQALAQLEHLRGNPDGYGQDQGDSRGGSAGEATGAARAPRPGLQAVPSPASHPVEDG